MILKKVVSELLIGAILTNALPLGQQFGLGEIGQIGQVKAVGLAEQASQGDPSGVFSNNGGFIITNAMLNMTYDKITWPMTHNSFARKGYFTPLSADHNLDIYDQLKYGIRSVEFDIDGHGQLTVFHGAENAGLNSRLEEVKNYASQNPNTIITVRINDTRAEGSDLVERINGRLIDTGLSNYIYNWDDSQAKANKVFLPSQWPTLKEIIDSGRNIMFIHANRYWDVVDSSAYRGLGRGEYNSPRYIHHYAAYFQEDFSLSQSIWSPANNDRQTNVATKGLMAGRTDRLFHIEVTPDEGYGGGSPLHATKNNDGRKLYQIGKQWEGLLPYDRVPNYIAIDYYMSEDLAGSPTGSNPTRVQPISILDATNRLNIERSGQAYNSVNGFVEFEPHEFDPNYIEIVSTTSQVRNEALDATERYKNGYEYMESTSWNGVIQSDRHWENLHGFNRLPEHALDGDYFTRWSDSTERDGNDIVIDFGAPKKMSEIAIAWEYPMRRPGYSVYGSNDPIMANEPDGWNDYYIESNNRWNKLGSKTYSEGSNVAWDILNFNEQAYRFIRVTIDDARRNAYPSMWEIKIYGPVPEVSIKNQWTNQYLALSNDRLTYVSAEKGDETTWILEDRSTTGDDLVAIKNKATGEYINLEGLLNNPNDNHVKLSNVPATYHSTLFRMEHRGGSTYRFESGWGRFPDNRYLNIEDRDRNIQITEIDDSWQSASWILDFK